MRTRRYPVELKHTERALDVAAVRYDRAGDQHYDVASAFIKSVRGSDVDAALHYLARMLEAGEDPRFIARRIVISAAEDVGMADPTALQTAVAAAQAVQLIGMPEGRIVLAEAVVHLATAPKSNAAYMGINKAIADVRAGLGNGIPAHLRDAHYPGSKQLGHGKGYKYAHDAPHSRGQRSSTRRTTWWAGTTTSPPPTAPSATSPCGWNGCGRSSAAAEPGGVRQESC